MKNFITIILFPVLLLILTGCTTAPSDTAVSDASEAKPASSDTSLADDAKASWGSVDFRVLESDDDLVFPLVIEFTNNKGEDMEADLLIETMSPEANYGPSEYEKTITIKKNPELLYVDFPITEDEKLYDVWVSVYVDDELSEQMYNSLIRLKPSMVKDVNELPPLPGEQMRELQDDDYMDEVYKQYPDFDKMELGKQIEIMMKAQAKAFGMTEEEYLKAIGSDAKAIEEVTDPSDEKINEINSKYGN